MKKKWTSGDVVQALRVAYGIAGSMLVQDEWSLLTEVPLRAPRTLGAHVYDERQYGGDTRTIDVLVTRNWPSGIGYRRLAFEVKVSKADYRRETDIKRLPAERAAHQTFYAAPVGLIEPESLPEGWGLVEVYPDAETYAEGTGRALGEWNLAEHVHEPGGIVREGVDYTNRGALCRVRAKAATREPVCDLDVLAHMAFRRASRAEERIRRGEDDAAAVPALRAEVATLTGQLERREGAVANEREKMKKIKAHYLALLGEQVCSECREPVGLNLGTGYWKHRSAIQETACQIARDEADRLDKERRFGARYTRGWAGPVIPLGLSDQAADLPTDRYGH